MQCTFTYPLFGIPTHIPQHYRQHKHVHIKGSLFQCDHLLQEYRNSASSSRSKTGQWIFICSDLRHCFRGNRITNDHRVTLNTKQAQMLRIGQYGNTMSLLNLAEQLFSNLYFINKTCQQQLKHHNTFIWRPPSQAH